MLGAGQRPLRYRTAVWLLGLLAAVVLFSVACSTDSASDSDSGSDSDSMVPVTLAPATTTPTEAAPVPTAESTPTEEVPNPLAASSLRLQIPSLGVDAPVITMGIDSQGVMEIPGDGQTVAWYDFTAAPGASGNAVMSAHVDYRGEEGVFGRIVTLEDGDEITVLSDGAALIYIVQSVELIRPEEADVARLVGSRDGAEQLTLITCGGTWDRQRREYDHRVIVQAIPVALDGTQAEARHRRRRRHCRPEEHPCPDGGACGSEICQLEHYIDVLQTGDGQSVAPPSDRGLLSLIRLLLAQSIPDPQPSRDRRAELMALIRERPQDVPDLAGREHLIRPDHATR